MAYNGVGPICDQFVLLLDRELESEVATEGAVAEDSEDGAHVQERRTQHEAGC